MEVGLVKRVHTLFGRNAQQVVYELQVWEEVEGVRQEVREVKRESKVEGESLTSCAHVDEMTSEHKTHDLSLEPCGACACMTMR